MMGRRTATLGSIDTFISFFSSRGSLDKNFLRFFAGTLRSHPWPYQTLISLSSLSSFFTKRVREREYREMSTHTRTHFVFERGRWGGCVAAQALIIDRLSNRFFSRVNESPGLFPIRPGSLHPTLVGAQKKSKVIVEDEAQKEEIRVRERTGGKT